VLLARRAHAPWHGLWGSPGGFCEIGEHPAETVVREVREETGFTVVVTDYLGTWVDAYADDPEALDAGVINVAYYSAALASDERGPVDPAEVSEVAWFAWDELPKDLAPPGGSHRGHEPSAHPPALTASRATSSGPPSTHWFPAGSRV
jgi:ADP-ribose pyrophosphatase YjhB (NUDIX family)